MSILNLIVFHADWMISWTAQELSALFNMYTEWEDHIINDGTSTPTTWSTWTVAMSMNTRQLQYNVNIRYSTCSQLTLTTPWSVLHLSSCLFNPGDLTYTDESEEGNDPWSHQSQSLSPATGGANHADIVIHSGAQNMKVHKPPGSDWFGNRSI
jgi:hypothetical protein